MNRIVLAALALGAGMPKVDVVAEDTGYAPAAAWPRKRRPRYHDGPRERARALAARIAGHVVPTSDEMRKARNKRKASNKAKKGGRS